MTFYEKFEFNLSHIAIILGLDSLRVEGTKSLHNNYTPLL